MEKTVSGNGGVSEIDGLANEDANLMIKLKFLTYKVRLHPEIDIKELHSKIEDRCESFFLLDEMDYLLKNYVF